MRSSLDGTDTKSVRRLARLVVALATIAIVVPGSGGGRFAGFPLDTLPELVALLVLLAFVITPNASSQLRQILHQISPKMHSLIVGLLLLIAIAKPIMHSSLPTTGGFDACYHSLFPVEDYPHPECEPFFSRLGEGGRSRIDPVIDFHGWSYPDQDNYLLGSNWNLSFVNNPDFQGRYPPFEHIRHTFTAKWSGEIESSFDNAVFPVVYTGQGLIDIDGEMTYLPLHFGSPTVKWINVQKGRHSFYFSYQFNNPVGQAGITEPKTEMKGFYATVRVGAIRLTPRFSHLSVTAWAVDPSTKAPIEFVEISREGKILTRITPTIPRPDVWKYLGEAYRSEPLGYVVPDYPFEDGMIISARFHDGTSRKLAEVDQGEIKWETTVIGDRLWAATDHVFPPLQHFDVLKSAPGSKFAEALTTLIDIIITITIGALGVLLVLAHRRVLTIVGLLAASVFMIEKFTDFPRGIGYDGVEGSSIVSISLLLCAAFLIPLCFVRRKAFLPVAFVSSLYLAVERTLTLNPGIRWDHFTPATEQISNLGYIFFRPKYSDWLIHAMLIRGSLFDGFLLGFEPIFYLQPGYRYIASALHWGFGDGDIIITAMFFFAMAIGGFLLIETVLQHSQSKIEQLVAALLTLSLLFILSSWVTNYFFLVQTTEIPTWGFTLLAIALALRGKPTFSRAFIPSILLGAAVVTRPNQLFGAFVVVLIILLLAQPQDETLLIRVRRWLLSIATFIGVSALPLLHNYYYGKQFELFSTSRPPGAVVPWESLNNILLGFFYQYRFRNPTETGIMGLPKDGASLTLEIGLYLLFLLWVFCLALLIHERPRTVKPWIYQFFPLAYLVPPMYEYHAYFPRHAFIFWLALFASVAITLSTRHTKANRTEGATETLRVSARTPDALAADNAPD
ncbi:MAG: hypothetical protein ABIQ38_04805 [Ilumatobacteraceae bacterium]